MNRYRSAHYTPLAAEPHRYACPWCEGYHGRYEHCDAVEQPKAGPLYHVYVRTDGLDWRTQERVFLSGNRDRTLGVAFHYATWPAYEQVKVVPVGGGEPTYVAGGAYQDTTWASRFT